MASLSYLASRLFLVKYRSSMRLLVALGSVQMGLVSVLLAPFLWDAPLPPLRVWLPWGLGNAFFFLAGQMMLLRALKTADSSQVAPLLGLKVPILGFITVFLLGQHLSTGGWVAVLLCTLAGLLVAPPHRIRDRQTLVCVLLACLGYAGSDLCIPELVRVVHDSSRYPTIFAVCITYSILGVVGMLMLSPYPEARLSWRAHRYAIPYSATWLIGMIALYVTFTSLGVVYGTIIQSTRGFMNVVLGILIVRLGWESLDGMRGWKTVLLRAAGALLMTAAIVLFHLTRAD